MIGVIVGVICIVGGIVGGVVLLYFVGKGYVMMFDVS